MWTQRSHKQSRKSAPPWPSELRQRGIALVIVLLLLSMLMVFSIAMTIAVSSDTMINGYYQNFRGAFYGADSGLNIARQGLVNGLTGAIPATFTVGNSPIPTGTETTVASNVLSSYASFTTINTGNAAASWASSFKLTGVTLTQTNCVVSYTGSPATAPTCAAPNQAGAVDTNFAYTYAYSITAVVQAAGGETTTLMDTGTLFVNAVPKPLSSVTSFAAWGMFINSYTLCDGSTLVPGTITGPVFSNGSWNLGTSGSYIFTDSFGSVGSTIGYQGSSCAGSANVSGSSYTSGGQTWTRTFQGGAKLGQNPVPLPTNSYSQERAVLDGIGVNSNQVTNTDLNVAVKDVNGTAYPIAGTSSGVFLPYSNTPTAGCSTAPCMTGGGILVQGDASVTLSPNGTSQQIYTITQGGTTTTVTVDLSAMTTRISNGGTSKTINGVPTLYNSTSLAAVEPATMLYVNGNITALKGPGQGQAAIQDGAAITITAASNITVTGDILYKTEPVTLTQNQSPCCPNTPADTLIAGNNKGQVLGIFTATGDIQMANAQSNGNLEIDAALATISTSGTGGLINTGNAINTLNIVGGRIQNDIKNINATTRNVFFDRRFSQGGFAPPWYPSTTITSSTTDTDTFTVTVQRLRWANTTTF
jgi:Tfp pilus assembly protein PilX